MEIKLKVEKIGNLEDYINLPIINRIKSENDSKPIGVIREAEELDNYYLLTAYIWDRLIKTDFEIGYDTIQSMEMSIR